MLSLLSLIYIAFISLGLPDSLLGSAWPVMRLQLGAPLPVAGLISMIISGGTIASSLMSERVTKRLGTGRTTAVSVAMTAVALLGFSISNSVTVLCLWSIPYGLGAGSVDAALNNYVALHYSSRHMSWLHCFWGLGASAGPYIMSAFLGRGNNWQGGYRAVGALQVVLVAVLVLSVPKWKDGRAGAGDGEMPLLGLRGALRIPGVPLILAAFLCYCAAEATAGLWASSYLVEERGMAPGTAAGFAMLYYLGITFGRFLNGFVADRLGDRHMIRIGIGVMLAGLLLIMLPASGTMPALAGLLVFGLGCAPIYPSVIHCTPDNFGAENSQAIIGIQMASAYTGTTFIPPLFGLIANGFSIALYPFFLALLTVLTLIMTERINRMVRGAA